MKRNYNFYNLTCFERICMIFFDLFKFFLFIFLMQYIFTSHNLAISLICLFACIIGIGVYLANKKINEKNGELFKYKDNYDELLHKYIELKK